MLRAAEPLGLAAKPSRRVKSDVAVPAGDVGLGVEEQFTIFGHKQEEEPVDEPKQLPVVVLRIEPAGAEFSRSE